jgi:hypothetical protein
MHAGSRRYTGSAAALLLAVFISVSLFTWDDVIRDVLTDDMISPWCRVGSLESWEGRPCAFPLRTGSIERAVDPR